MDGEEMTIRELECLYRAGKWTEELQRQCLSDSRTGVQRLVRRWERDAQERARVEALYHYEFLAREKGCLLVAGVDEAGRGPLAGPVVVAAVILPLGLFLPHLNDSKKLSPAVREHFGENHRRKEYLSSDETGDVRSCFRLAAAAAACLARCRAVEAFYDVFSHCPRGCKVGVDCGGIDRGQSYEGSPDAEI